MDAQAWWDCYARLTKAYNKPQDTVQSEVFFDALRDLPTGDVERAVAVVLREKARFPVPADIREQVTLARAAAAREQSPVPNFEPISDEKSAELVALIRATREKIFGRNMS